MSLPSDAGWRSRPPHLTRLTFLSYLTLLELAHRLLHFAQVRVGPHRVSDMRNFAVQSDQKARSPGQVPAPHPHAHAVCIGDLSIRVRQQWKIAAVFGNKFLMALR